MQTRSHSLTDSSERPKGSANKACNLEPPSFGEQASLATWNRPPSVRRFCGEAVMRAFQVDGPHGPPTHRESLATNLDSITIMENYCDKLRNRKKINDSELRSPSLLRFGVKRTEPCNGSKRFDPL